MPIVAEKLPLLADVVQLFEGVKFSEERAGVVAVCERLRGAKRAFFEAYRQQKTKGTPDLRERECLVT